MTIKGGRPESTAKLQWISWSCTRLLLLIVVTTQGTASAQNHQQSGFECNNEGYYEDPRSCSIYYRCVNWGNGSPLTKFKFECGPGTVFSHAKGDICVHPRESERSDCSESANDLGSVHPKPSSNGQTGPPAAYPDYPSYGSPLPGTPSSGLSSTTSGVFESTSNENSWSTSNNYPGNVHEQNNRGTLCQQEGFKPDEKDCRKFIRCVSNGGGGYQSYEFTCGDGTVWDQSIEACNHAWAISKSNCSGMSNGGFNVGGGSEGSNEQSGYPGSSGEPGNTEPSESNEVPRPPGGYPQGGEVATGSGGPVPGYPQNPNQGYPQSPPDTSYPPELGSQSPHEPSELYPPPSSGYPSSPPNEKPDERPGQSGDSSTGSLYPPPYPGVPSAQPDNPSTSESSELPGPTAFPEEGSTRPPSGLYPPPAQYPGEQTGASGLGKPKPDASGSCKEEGFLPDPSDCKKFYRCVEGEGLYQKYEFTCAEGTAWDQALLTCNHEYAVPGCGSSAGSNRPAATDNETTPSSSSSEVTSEPDSNPQSTSSPVDMTSPESTTAGASGTTISSQPNSSSSTEIPEDGTTEGAKEPDATSEGSTSESNESSSSPSSSTTASPSDGSSTTPKTDEGSSGSTPTRPTSGSCEAEGFFGDPSDCHKFYRCVSFDHSSKTFTKFKFNCGPGTAWDQNLQTCNYENQVESCEGSSGSKPSSEAPDESMNEIESSSKASESPEVTSPSSTGTEGSSTSVETTGVSEDTTVSLSETEETSTPVAATESSEVTTPSSSETEETSTPAEITEPAEAMTTPSSETQGTTPSDITESTPDMNSEASTSSGSTEEPKDTSTSLDTESTASDAATTPVPESSSSSPSGTTPSSQSSSSKFKCTNEGFFPNPSDCHKFIRCVKVNNGFIKYDFDCGPGTAWDQNLLTCNYEEQVESCEASGTSTTDLTESSVSTESSTTPGDQSTGPESTETTQDSTGAESTTAGGEEGQTTPTGAEETTTGSDETATTEGTEGPEATEESEAPETTESTSAVSPGSMSEPCTMGNLTDEQIVLVCPTGFRRHPKFCNMFYQCTNAGNMEIKVLVLACPVGTIFDDNKVQCLAEGETDQKCTSPVTSRFYRQLEDAPISPVRVTRSVLCPDEGHYPYLEGCSNAFYKCERNSRNSLQGYLYKCPKDFVYWSVSRRCERASRLPMCSQVKDENNERQHSWENRSNLPIEEFNLSARSLKI